MANIKKKEYKPKKANEIKLMLFLKKLKDGNTRIK